MKNSRKIAYCGVFSALATVFLVIGAYTPLTFTCAFLASVCVVSNALAFPKGLGRCIVCFIVSTVVSCFFIPSPISVLPYAFIFAPIIIIKLFVDRSDKKPAIKFVIKVVAFEILFIAYLVVYRSMFFSNWQEMFREVWMLVLFIIASQALFFVYDHAFTGIFRWLEKILMRFIPPEK